MQTFKRSHFENAHPGVEFPDIQALSALETAVVRSKVWERLHCSERDDGLAAAKMILSRSVPVKEQNAQDHDFRLLSVLWALRLEPMAVLYVNWYRFDDIDRIHRDDLATYFQDIWYPSSDDIDIFDDSFDWILSVGHGGDVRLARLAAAGVGRKPTLRRSR